MDLLAGFGCVKNDIYIKQVNQTMTAMYDHLYVYLCQKESLLKYFDKKKERNAVSDWEGRV